MEAFIRGFKDVFNSAEIGEAIATLTIFSGVMIITLITVVGINYAMAKMGLYDG